jgi:hypothetical protein
VPPLVIVENGSLVANANSFVTRDDVLAYCVNRGYSFSLTDTALADAAVIKGADWLKNTMRLNYRGSLRTATQTMPWPREDASMYRGPSIANTVVPQCVKDAQCELAYRAFAGTNLQPDLARGGATKREKLDVIEVEYFPGAPSETVLQSVLGMLAPVLVDPGMILPEPYQAQPVDRTPYLPGEFGNPPTTYTTDPAAVS